MWGGWGGDSDEQRWVEVSSDDNKDAAAAGK